MECISMDDACMDASKWSRRHHLQSLLQFCHAVQCWASFCPSLCPLVQGEANLDIPGYQDLTN